LRRCRCYGVVGNEKRAGTAGELRGKGTEKQMKNRIAVRMRNRRSRIGFQQALDAADPSMRKELLALATKQENNI
jgi:hypothetical protein